MTELTIQGLTKRFDGKPPTTAMDSLDLRIEDGEFLVLLGSSGCGKTTTLRCLAGLETPDSGRILFGDTTVFDADSRTNVSPDRRSIGMVFQSYALWPHMTVRKNIGYPLRARRVGGSARSWVEETARLVDCESLLDRYPSQLSGGQQQRVALARGLVARPDVVLFDEPLSNLDAKLRDSVRSQLHELHSRLRFTAVFVTHDQTEALALADRMAIMRNGRFEQVGTPDEVFDEPHTEFVADFIGMANQLRLRRTAEGWMFGETRLAGSLPLGPSIGDVTVRARPDDFEVVPRSAASGVNGKARLDAEVIDSQYGGRHMDVTVAVGQQRLSARVPSEGRNSWARCLQPGAPVELRFDPIVVRYFDADGAVIDDRRSSARVGVAG